MNNPSKPCQLSVIIVTWRNDAVLKNCLESLVAVYRREIPEVIVVDNGNQESTKSLVKRYTGIKYISCAENLGFAGGNNVGLK